MKGGCSCGSVRYTIDAEPMIVHGCHCTWCQRETGSAFAINVVVETAHVKVTAGTPMEVDTPSASGRGQVIARCPTCYVAVWSHYAVSGKNIAFVRAGTLDQPHDIAPDVHIYTSTKRPWVVLPEGSKAVPEFYDPKTTWSPEARARFAAARG
jgi:hypothetical protein